MDAEVIEYLILTLKSIVKITTTKGIHQCKSPRPPYLGHLQESRIQLQTVI